MARTRYGLPDQPSEDTDTTLALPAVLICGRSGSDTDLMSRYVAFLRAINTPPRWVKMERLRASFTEAGYANVATYIASGNVIFEASSKPNVDHIESIVEAACGFYSEVFLRNSVEIRSVLERVPWPDQRDEVAVSFLRRRPKPTAIRALEAVGEDQLQVRGTELYLLRAPPGLQSTIDRCLRMPMTRRGLATVENIWLRFLAA